MLARAEKKDGAGHEPTIAAPTREACQMYGFMAPEDAELLMDNAKDLQVSCQSLINGEGRLMKTLI